MALDLSALDLASIPDLAPGHDRIVSVIVFDRPDPAGADPEAGAASGAASYAYLTEMSAILGVNPETGVFVRSATYNTETTVESFAVDGLSPLTPEG